LTNTDGLFGLANLPYGVFSTPGTSRRCGVRVGDQVLDLAVALDDPVFAQPSLNAFMAQGRESWARVRSRIPHLLTVPGAPLLDLSRVAMHLPFEVGDYVDFYASEHHATNVGRIFRPDAQPLTPNWKHLPIGYHGRSGTVVVSGKGIRRPHGQRKPPDAAAPVFGPSRRMDFEAEVGFVIGTGSELGVPVTVEDFEEHVFGVFLVNDWSSRDLQAWESVPLGPFLGKSFATSISPWIVPLSALSAARRPTVLQDPVPLPYLDDAFGGFDLALEIRLNGSVISTPSFTCMYWTPAQMLAHLTVNGASVRTGDFYASGTVSGPHTDELGCLLELSWGGTRPFDLADGSTRTFLEDGDEVIISATAPATDGTRLGFGEVKGVILLSEQAVVLPPISHAGALIHGTRAIGQ
jgi:fumarylacetoacetase